MYVSKTQNENSRYYDNLFKVYIDELPDGYAERDGEVILEGRDLPIKTIEVLEFTCNSRRRYG